MNSSSIPPGDIQLRASVVSDESVLYALFTVCRDDLLLALASLESVQQESLLRMQFQAQREQYRQTYPQACQSMIIYKNEIIGQMLVDRDRDICLVDMGLRPEYRNRGIGGALLRTLLDEAARSDKRVVLHVAQGNPAARLYGRLGFTDCGGGEVYRSMVWASSTLGADQADEC